MSFQITTLEKHGCYSAFQHRGSHAERVTAAPSSRSVWPLSDNDGFAPARVKTGKAKSESRLGPVRASARRRSTTKCRPLRPGPSHSGVELLRRRWSMGGPFSAHPSDLQIQHFGFQGLSPLVTLYTFTVSILSCASPRISQARSDECVFVKVTINRLLRRASLIRARIQRANQER